jgi:hypothetical protein
MAKVFITQEGQFDFTDAGRYGDVESLAHEDLYNIKGSRHNEQLIRAIRWKLRSFDDRVDFILISGSPYIVAVVFMILGQMGIHYVQVLRWSNRDRRYDLCWIEIPRREENERVQVKA